jgi:hypothetical protein
MVIQEEHGWRVFENRGCWGEYLDLRGKKWLGGWRSLHNEELYILCTSPNIFRVIKSRQMRWAWQLTWGR